MQIDSFKIRLLEEASQQLIKTLDLRELLKKILKIAKRGLKCDRGTVYVVDSKKNEIWSIVLIGKELKEIRLPIGEGLAGYVAKTGEILNIEDAYKDKRFKSEFDRYSGYHTKSCLCVPIVNSENKITGVMQMLNKKKGKFDILDENFLKSLSNYSATALELATLHEQIVDKKRIEDELSIARQIQVSLFPRKIPEIENYDILGDNNSCETVSGDYYDFFHLGDDKYLFAIGDVSGKGIPASLMMAILQSHLKAITKTFNPLPETVRLLNEYLVKNSTSDKFITFFIGILDSKAHTFEYVNAGHNPPVFINKNGDLRELKLGGPLIGMFGGLEYTSETVKFKEGDLLVSFTDGVTECMNMEEEEYGEDKLYPFLIKQNINSPKKIFDNLVTELTEFAAGQKQSDDITVLMLKRK